MSFEARHTSPFLDAGDSALRRLDGVRPNVHLQPLANHAEDGGQIVHRRIASFRKHPMQALGRLRRLRGEFFEADRCVDEVTQDEAGGAWLAIEEQRWPPRRAALLRMPRRAARAR